MIEVGGIIYKLDLDRFSNILVTKVKDDDKHTEVETKTTYDPDGKPLEVTVTSREFDKIKEINAPKYDIIRMCLEILLTYNEPIDDTLGQERAFKDTSIPFKVAFNTLLEYKILVEIEE